MTAIGTATVYIGDSEYDENNIFNLSFKQKLNQVGRFQFEAHGLTDDDLDILCEQAIITIKVEGVARFYGFINKVTTDKYKKTWHFEGPSLAGIFDTKVTRLPIILRRGSGGTTINAKDVLAEVLFHYGAFYDIGSAGFKLVGGNGSPLFFYKIETRSVLDQIVSLAKISGYDWQVYLDV